MLAALRRAVPAGPLTGRDTGGIVLGWLTRLTVIMAVGGIALFDAISVGSTKATLADQGQQAAREASETWQTTKSVQDTYAKAVEVALEQNADNVVLTKGFSIDPDGTVHLTVRRKASTLVLYRWDRTASWAKVTASVQGLSVQ